MESTNVNICTPLPSNITKRISIRENNEQYVTNFLQNVLPSSDTKSIGDELRKAFILSKHRSKQNGKKPCKGKFLTSRKRRYLGLRKIGCKNDMKYNDVIPLNKLWLKYMQQMLGNKFFTNLPQDPIDPNWEAVNQQLIKADLHGAEIAIIRSRCPSLVDLRGIIVQDTKNTFRICCKDNIIRTIPKDVVVLDIYLGPVKLQLFGKELCIRPIERTVKKIKTARAFEL